MLIRPSALDEQHLVRHPLPVRKDELWTSSDPLGEALHMLRMTGLFYCRSELTAPWGLFMPPMPGCLWFHVVTVGSCVLTGSGVGTLRLSPGDFALVPHGRGHRLGTSAGQRTPDVTELPQTMLSDRYALLEYGGGGERTTLICGVVRFDQAAGVDLAEVLPPLLHLQAGARRESEGTDWAEGTLRMIAAEARRLRPGGETIITRLADVLVIHAVRAWLQEEGPQHRGWLSALREPSIGQALTLIHRAPSEPWTVELLAQRVGMSRSAFSARFTDWVGEPPMKYVARQRMRVAAAQLEEQRHSVAQLAAQSGYQSEAAFRRAFKRCLGVSPGQSRRRARNAPSSQR